jgi:hypothetical protein
MINYYIFLTSHEFSQNDQRKFCATINRNNPSEVNFFRHNFKKKNNTINSPFFNW